MLVSHNKSNLTKGDNINNSIFSLSLLPFLFSDSCFVPSLLSREQQELRINHLS